MLPPGRDFLSLGEPSPNPGLFFSSDCIFLLPISISMYTSYMKYKSATTNRHAFRRQTALRRLAQTGPFLEGSLCSFKRPGCSIPGWHLTFKQKAKTRTVYVPLDLVPEVKRWNQAHKQLKKLIREVSRHSLALIHAHVANRRAAERSRALTRR
jgi:hypothetical protein